MEYNFIDHPNSRVSGEAERIAKLPRWAQSLINVLGKDLEGLRTKTQAAGTGDTNTFISDLMELRGLPPNSIIQFDLGWEPGGEPPTRRGGVIGAIEVRASQEHEGCYLDIVASHRRIQVIPLASNRVLIGLDEGY